MVHGEYGVVVAQMLRDKRGVGGQRSDEGHAFATKLIEYRLHDLDFLAPQVSTFARMRIESEHGDSRRRQGETLSQVAGEDTQCPLQALPGDG